MDSQQFIPDEKNQTNSRHFRPTPRAMRALYDTIKALKFKTIHHSIYGRPGDRCLGVVMLANEALSFGAEVVEHFLGQQLAALPPEWKLPAQAKKDLLDQMGEICAMFHRAEINALNTTESVIFWRMIPYPLTPELA